MPENKFSAFLTLLVVFLSGVAVGALAYRLYTVHTVYTSSAGNDPRQPKQLDPEEVRRRIIADVKAKVHLDDSQVAALDKLMDETHDTWRKMRDRINAEGRAFHLQEWQKFRSILRPDQQPLYDQWRTERDEEMRKRREQHPGPPHP